MNKSQIRIYFRKGFSLNNRPIYWSEKGIITDTDIFKLYKVKKLLL